MRHQHKPERYPGQGGDEARADKSMKLKEHAQMQDAEKRHRGLLALAACAGNARQAERLLRRTKSPVKVTYKTLTRWRDEEPDVYARLADEHGAALEAELIVDHREAALKAMEVMDEALDHTKEKLHHMSAREASDVVHDMSRVVASSTKDLLLLTGRPTDISDNRGAVEIIRALGTRFPRLFDNLNEPEPVDAEPVPDEENLLELPPPPQEPAPDVEEAF
jgi:hypothetical protein